MTSSPTDLPETTSGPIILNAQLTVAGPDQAKAVADGLLRVQKHALSDAEPGCLEFKPSKSFNQSGNIVFAVWEKYASPAAVKEHMDSAVFKAFAAELQSKSLLTGPLDIKYFSEL